MEITHEQILEDKDLQISLFWHFILANDLYSVALGTSSLANKLREKGFKLYYNQKNLPDCSELRSVSIISRTTDLSRIRELKKTISKYNQVGTPNKFEVFVVAPYYLKDFYQINLIEECFQNLVNLVFYTSKKTIPVQSARVRGRQLLRNMNVGDARNAVLSVGCAINCRNMIMSDDDRSILNVHFGNWGDKKSKKLCDNVKELYEHIEKVFSNNLPENMNKNEYPVAMIGFTSIDRNRWFWTEIKKSKNNEMFQREKCCQCAQLVVLNFDVLKKHKITYNELRMGEDNYFQYNLMKNGLYCIESAHIAHGSLGNNLLGSTCRNDKNSHIENYSNEDLNNVKEFIKSGLISFKLSNGKNKPLKERIVWQIQWTINGVKHNCFNFSQYKLEMEKKIFKELPNKIKKWDEKLQILDAKWNNWVLNLRPEYLQRQNNNTHIPKRLLPPNDKRLESYQVDVFDADFDYMTIPRNLPEKEKLNELAGWQNLGQLLSELYDNNIIKINKKTVLIV